MEVDALVLEGKAAKDEGTLGDTLRILSYNVFIGSPLPYLRGGTPSLHGTGRLEKQARQVAALNADIICLQEAFCLDVIRGYKRALGSEYAAIYHHVRPPCRAFTSMFIIYLLFTGLFYVFLKLILVFSFIWPVLTSSTSLWNTFWDIATVGGALFLVHFSFNKSAVKAFLLGSVQAGTAILYRRSKVSPVAHGVRDFLEQRGDGLNVHRKRGYQYALFKMVPPPHGATESYHEGHFWILNTHINLGKDSYRQEQVAELLRGSTRLGWEYTPLPVPPLKSVGRQVPVRRHPHRKVSSIGRYHSARSDGRGKQRGPSKGTSEGRGRSPAKPTEKTKQKRLDKKLEEQALNAWKDFEEFVESIPAVLSNDRAPSSSTDWKDAAGNASPSSTASAPSTMTAPSEASPTSSAAASDQARYQVPLVLCGDLNVDDVAGSIGMLRIRGGLKDVWLEAGRGNGATWTMDNPLTVGYHRAPDHRCDYVFYRNKDPLLEREAEAAAEASGMQQDAAGAQYVPTLSPLAGSGDDDGVDSFGELSDGALTRKRDGGLKGYQYSMSDDEDRGDTGGTGGTTLNEVVIDTLGSKGGSESEIVEYTPSGSQRGSHVEAQPLLASGSSQPVDHVSAAMAAAASGDAWASGHIAWGGVVDTRSVGGATKHSRSTQHGSDLSCLQKYCFCLCRSPGGSDSLNGRGTPTYRTGVTMKPLTAQVMLRGPPWVSDHYGILTDFSIRWKPKNNDVT